MSLPPSPQVTETAHAPSSVPGSANEPRVNALAVPSFALWLAGAVTVGATLATVTVNVAVPTPPSLSVTFTVTVYVPLSA